MLVSLLVLNWLIGHVLWSLIGEQLLSTEYRDARRERVLRSLFVSLVMFLALGDIAVMLGPISCLFLLGLFILNWWMPFVIGVK